MSKGLPRRIACRLDAYVAEALVRMTPDPGEAERVSATPTVLMVRTNKIKRRVAPRMIAAYSKVHGFDFRYHRDGSRAFELVLDGPWDRKPVSALSVEDYSAFREHFVDGRAWNETGRFRMLMRSGNAEAQVAWSRKAAFWDRLYQEMRDNGYRRQEDVRPDLRLGNQSTEGSALNEIQVAISRHGEMLRVGGGGNHRFLLATILGIEEIPVVVNAWHQKSSRPSSSKPKWPLFHPAGPNAAQLGAGT